MYHAPGRPVGMTQRTTRRDPKEVVVGILDSVKQLKLRVGAVVRGREGGEDDRELGSRTRERGGRHDATEGTSPRHRTVD
jgi:hypothetical protein